MASYDNTAPVGITLVDELQNFDLEKCAESSRRHRAVPSPGIAELQSPRVRQFLWPARWPPKTQGYV